MEIKNLAIYLSRNCNLSCSYCHYHSTNKSKTIESSKLLRKIELFLKLKNKDKKITFLGGEPLMHEELLEKAVKFIRNRDLFIPITVFTNGTLLNKNNIDFFKTYFVKLILSVDGDLKDNDAFRKFRKSGNSVFKCIYKKMVYIKELNNQNISVNMVVSPENAVNLNKNIAFIYELGFRSIGWNIDLSRNWNRKHIDELKKQIINLELSYLKLIKEKKELYEFSNVYELIDDVAYGRKSECENLSLFPDGRFYLCDKVIGVNENKKFEIDSPYGINYKKRDSFFEKMRKKNMDSKGLMCPIGIYLFYRYVKNIKGNKLKREFKRSMDFLNMIEDMKKAMIRKFLRYSSFKKLHNIR